MNKLYIDISENKKLALTEFLSQEVKAEILLIASATGVKQTFYHKFAAFFSKDNFHVYTFDYEGIGESRPKSLIELDVSASDWGEKDLNTVINYLKQKYPTNKLIVIGHSIGGQLIGLASSNSLIDEIILVAAQTGYWKPWPIQNRMRMFLLWHFLIPILTKLFNYFPGKRLGLSEDLPKNVALEWAKWCRSPLYLFDYKQEAYNTFNNVKAKIISYSFSDDNYAPKKAVDWLTEKYTNASIERVHIKPDEVKIKKVGHFGFFSSKNQSSLWEKLKSEIATNR